MGALLAADGGIDQTINDAFTVVSTAVQDVIFYSVTIAGATFPLVVAWLALAAIIFTIYYRFINLRGFTHSIRLVKGDYTGPDEVGEVSHFQALATAVSGTVGLGNIAGVAVAITIGGPGATFWMIIAGLLSMSTKFAECTLGVKYRRENADGTVSGGRCSTCPAVSRAGAWRARQGPRGRLRRLLHLRLAGRRQRLPVQPGVRADEGRHRWRRRLPRRQRSRRAASASSSRSSSAS
jgi:hypothetical protein